MLALDTWIAFDFYKTFLQWYCSWYNPRYLEIGCLGGDLCASLRTTRAIGVDVNEHPDWSTYMARPELEGKVEFYKLSSNEFFLQNDEQFDLIFIDGDHRAKQVRLDVKNALHCLADGGLIVLHDTLPPTPGDADDTKCGDAYKVRQELESQGQGLQVYTFPVTFGLTLVAPKGTEWPW